MNTTTPKVTTTVTINTELVKVEQHTQSHTSYTPLNPTEHTTGSTAHSRFHFANDYVVSTVRVAESLSDCKSPGSYYCTADTDTYELAILSDDGIVYDLDIQYGEDSSTLGDVCGFITREEVNTILRAVQKLPKKV